MGMTCTLYRITSAETEQLIEDPSELDAVLGFDKGLPMREVRPKGILGLLLRLTPVTIHEDDPDAKESDFEIDPEKEISVEKGWHGLHFLFTGTADEGSAPACYMLKGGEDLDDEGLVRAIRPRHVKHFAEFLDELTPDVLRKRYDPRRMMELEIYPEIWDRAPTAEDDPLRWLLKSFAEVKDFVKRAAAAGDGLVIHTS